MDGGRFGICRRREKATRAPLAAADRIGRTGDGPVSPLGAAGTAIEKQASMRRRCMRFSRSVRAVEIVVLV